MKIVVDNKIPYIREVFEPFGEVIYLNGSSISAKDVVDADALIVRTRTICNRELLEGSRVKVIATATIGFDHIDQEYCKSAGIEWSNAPGCNAGSVAQYIAAALSYLSVDRSISLEGKKIGIVGVGNVGSKVAKVAESLGMIPLLNDPPREDAESLREGADPLHSSFVSLSQIENEADFITFHTPLIKSGEYKTLHLADREFFSRLKRNPTIINSSRGEVVDGVALKEAIESGAVSASVIDCWEGEPNIDMELLDMVDIATPHIAGYSRDGKAKGSAMAVEFVAKILNLDREISGWSPNVVEIPDGGLVHTLSLLKEEQAILQAVLSTYTIIEDSNRLKESVETFEKQRGDYPIRREFLAHTVELSNSLIDNNRIKKRLKELHFTLK